MEDEYGVGVGLFAVLASEVVQGEFGGVEDTDEVGFEDGEGGFGRDVGVGLCGD